MNRITKVGLLFIVISVLPVMAQDIPRPVGWVNDFANVLSPGLERSLNNKLQSYKNETGIEIAVVTISSLQNYSIEDFTITLAQRWGVGDKEKDNGVVLLLAPNEREVRIEVGYGLEGDLTDGQSGYILDQNAVPYFRDEDWASGVNATVNALINHLGQKNYQVRFNERVEREKVEQAMHEQAEAERVEREKTEQALRAKAEAERAKRNAEFAAALGTFFTFAIPIAVVTGGFFISRYLYRRRKLLKEIQRENFERISDIDKKLEKMKPELDDAERVFDGLKKVNIDSLRSVYSSMLNNLKDFLTVARFETLPVIWRDYPKYKEARRIREKIEKLEKEIPQAEEKIKLVAGLPVFIAAKHTWVLEHKDEIISGLVGSRMRLDKMLSRLDANYHNRVTELSNGALANIATVNSALSCEDKNKVDWSGLSAILENVELGAKQIDKLLDEYIGLVEKAKSDRDNLLASLDGALKNASDAVRHSDVSPGTINELKPATADLRTVKQAVPKSDQEWVLFLTSATAVIATLNGIARKAAHDVEEAEEKRRRARRLAEEARQAQIRAMEASRRSISSSSGSRGFGGGSFGGGGASRRF